MARTIHDRLDTAADLLTKIAAGNFPTSNADKAAARDSAAAVKTIAEPGGWTLLRAVGGGTPTKKVSLTMDPSLKSALMDAAEEFGVVMTTAAAEGFRRFIEGDFVPAKARIGAGAVLSIRADEDLLEQVDAAIPAVKEAAGYRITRSSIATAWLAEELGVERVPGTGLRLMLLKPLRDHFLAAEKSGASLQEILEEGIRAVLAGKWGRPEAPHSARNTVTGVDRVSLTIPVDSYLLKELHEATPRLSEQFGTTMYPGKVARAILTARLGAPAE